MESELFKRVKKSKKVLVMAVAMLVFCATLFYVFFFAKNTISEAGVPNQSDAVGDSYQEYKNYISDTNKGIKGLLEGEQLKQITLYEYSFENKNFETNNNPFLKSF